MRLDVTATPEGPWLGLLLVVALFACSACADSPTSPDPGTPLMLTRLTAEPYSFTYRSGLREPQRLVVRDRNTWQQTWNAIGQGATPQPLPEIDFSREMVIVAAMGEKPSGGFSVFVAAAAEAANGVAIQIRSVSPGPGCAVTLALTQPVDIARVTRRDGPVTFSERSEVQSCN